MRVVRGHLGRARTWRELQPGTKVERVDVVGACCGSYSAPAWHSLGARSTRVMRELSSSHADRAGLPIFLRKNITRLPHVIRPHSWSGKPPKTRKLGRASRLPYRRRARMGLPTPL